VDATSECLNNALDLLSRCDDTFATVLVDVRGKRARNLELVRVWIWGLCLSKFLDLT
jgi:hypothetical protein